MCIAEFWSFEQCDPVKEHHKHQVTLLLPNKQDLFKWTTSQVPSDLLLLDQKWRQPPKPMLNSSSSIWKPTSCPATAPLFSALLQSKKQCLTDCALCLSSCLTLVTCCTATRSLAIGFWEIVHRPSWKTYAPQWLLLTVHRGRCQPVPQVSLGWQWNFWGDETACGKPGLTWQSWNAVLLMTRPVLACACRTPTADIGAK